MSDRDQTKKRIYVAGPMTGIPGYNYHTFNRVSKELRRRGFEVVNPVDVCAKYGTLDELIRNPALVDAAMKEELDMIPECDGIYLLDGWHLSNGAKRELETALHWGLRVYVQPV